MLGVLFSNFIFPITTQTFGRNGFNVLQSYFIVSSDSSVAVVTTESAVVLQWPPG